ncbi:MAG TPA: HEAT repeat domain-containing protein, partial [Thermoanaerobaculia bacterium]|nr:HEAT repeat domain-containing protein [Thermoanaerobaculia bacterium]
MRSVDELVRTAIQEPDDDVRWSAIEELNALGTRDVYDRAVSLCRASSAEERAAGARILGELSTWAKDSVPVLTTLFRDDDATVVEAAVHAVAQLNDARGCDSVSALATHSAPNVRWAVATALANAAHEERFERVLLALMKDEDSAVRDRATFAIGSLSEHDTPRIRAALFERLRDAERSVAHEAALGLARRRDARAIPYIAAAVAANDEEIEEAADEITTYEMLPELLKMKNERGVAA